LAGLMRDVLDDLIHHGHRTSSPDGCFPGRLIDHGQPLTEHVSGKGSASRLKSLPARTCG
jgi:hypothetical protein